MGNYRFILEPYKTPANRHTCISCGHRKTFTFYIDTETGERVGDTVGTCNRLINCGYKYTPKQYFQDNNIQSDVKHFTRQPAKVETKPVSYIGSDILKQSLQSYEQNNFALFLLYRFGLETMNKLIGKYFIGTSKHWDGAVVYWQIDITGRTRTGKIMLYSKETGKRSKEAQHHPYWVHKALKQPDFHLQQCLFGSHLLKPNPLKPVALCESEKSAIIASIYFPQVVWLATGGLQNLTYDKCKVLSGRNVTLFPDLGGFEEWSAKAKEFSTITKFHVSEQLERIATDEERNHGLDIADYLLRFNHKEYETKTIESEFSGSIKKEDNSETVLPENWQQEIEGLESFFRERHLKKEPVKLFNHCIIKDPELFIESHLMTVKNNNGKRSYLPYLHRLKSYKSLLTKIVEN